jgi:polysaccharide biosynthesis protein PslG
MMRTFRQIAGCLIWFAILKTVPCSALAGDGSNPFGVGSSAEAAGAYTAWMPRMSEARAKWVRIFPDWNQIQPSPEKWQWSAMDALLNCAASNHLNVSGLFLYNAKWANTNGSRFPTNNLAAWSTYVSNVVAHAAGRVRYWEVWNEPENFSPGGSAGDYAMIVSNAYSWAKAADPNAQIGIGVATVDILYLERALAAGAADHFDYICVHPYEVLGTVASGQEALFMNIVPTIRKMLAVKNPAKQQAPVWFTEIGEALGKQVDSSRQAADLVKAYTMGIAQGVAHLEWFEAQEGGYKMGLLSSTEVPAPAFYALKHLATQLGPNPSYLGWLLLNDHDYAFVFQGATNNVAITWSPPNSTETVELDRGAQIMDPVSGEISEAKSFQLSNAPHLILNLPAKLIEQARKNASQPFPWNGDYSGASNVSITMGEQNVERGLHQLNAGSSSTAVTAAGSPARDCSKGSSVTFTVDPNFLCYTQTPIRISAVVRKISNTDNPGFNLRYESASGRKGIGWNSIPGNDKWYTLTWTIADDKFVGDWGYHFSFDSDSTKYSKYYLQQVTVTKLMPAPATGSR